MKRGYSEKTIRRKARLVGYGINKGFQHFLGEGYPVFSDRTVGYNVVDCCTGALVWGCYNSVRDHLFTFEDVKEFIKSIYEENGLDF